MAHADRGVKRRCQECGAPFYDLNRSPIVCPKCEAAFTAETPRVPVRAGSRSSTRSKPPLPAAEPEIAEEEVETFDEDEVLDSQDEDEGDFLPADQSEDGDEMRE